jgi:ADP-ribose pyrophosphatase YjhB (NUDIX family)
VSQVEDLEGKFQVPPYVRPLAICVLRRADGAVLLAAGFDEVKGERFYRPLGGTIEFGERSEETVRRELREELGAEIDEPRLLAVFENIFEYRGRPGHELVWVYEAGLAQPALTGDDVILADEGGARFEAHWIHPNDLLGGGPKLYPERLLELLTAT